MLDTCCIRSLNPGHILITIGRVPANTSASRYEQTQSRPRQIAGADQQHGTGLQIEKYRQESHAPLAHPTFRVDWNYFLYISDFTAAKRKFFLLYCNATIEFQPLTAKGQRCIFSTRKSRALHRFRISRPETQGTLMSGNFPPLFARCGLRWITSTRSRPKAFTFSGKPLRG